MLCEGKANLILQFPTMTKFTETNVAELRKISSKKAAFGRSFRGLLPTPFAQVQPPLSDISELLHLAKDLRRHELPLKTELLEHKLVRET
ncbi:hypothetical protein NL676_028930 [Syzygium grande]|nr:hypothetical protein NL676_028930 [Syzygium grande]